MDVGTVPAMEPDGGVPQPRNRHRNPRLGGGSFALRLIALCLVPVLGLGWLGTIRVQQLDESVREAELILASAELHGSLIALSQAAQSERLALTGLALGDELGLSRDLIATLSGMDMEAVYRHHGMLLDVELSELDGRLRNSASPVAGELLGRLEATSAELIAVRRQSEAQNAAPEQVALVFNSLEALARDAREIDELHQRTTAVVMTADARLGALRHAIHSANDYATALMDSLLDSDIARVIEVEKALAVHRSGLDALEVLLPEDARGGLTTLRSALDGAAGGVGGVVGDVEIGPAADVGSVAAAALPLVGVFDYLADLGEFSERFQEAVVTEAQAFAASVRSESTRTEIALYAVGVLTVILIAVIAASTIAPLRRLGRRAEAIGHGELALDPLPLRGPGIVRTLTSTVNDMLATLHRVDGQISDLAVGRAAPAASEIPGPIGRSLRNSVDRLARATAQRQRSEQLASAIVAQAADAIWAVDASGVIHTANEATEQLLGVGRAKQIGRPLTDFLESMEGEASLVGRPDVRAHLTRSGDALHDDLVTVIARDVTERVRLERQLAHQARQDPLTLLPNRFAVLERLQTMYDGREAVGVMFIDVDGFKSVNDTRGHDTGDRVLVEIGRRLAAHVRPHDFVGRLGGDEFVVLVRGVADVADLRPFGERLIREIECPYEDDGSMFTLSASVGVAVMDQSVPALEMIRRADSAVYAAKRHGRGRVEAYDAQLQASIEHDAELELALRDAIRGDELVLHLQPIIDLRTQRTSGVEALVRWQRPHYGLIPPGDFIPIAERSSLIVDLQRWVLRRSCEILAEWRRRDPAAEYSIAINISGRHLIDGDLLTDLKAALDATGADPRLIEFELTETQLLADVDRATAVLNEVRRLGITVSVDDFGTGFSSMTYLRDLPIDAIKIDRTFLAQALAEDHDEPLVDAMLTIGRSLDLAVVAEGVESEFQLRYVRSRGCDFAQGFLFSPPLPIEEIERTLFPSLVASE